jgi:hypothetical protein
VLDTQRVSHARAELLDGSRRFYNAAIMLHIRFVVLSLAPHP